MRRIDVNVLTPDGLCPSVVIAPDGEGSWPAVIMFMDAGGVRQGMVEMAERLAGLRYVAFLPRCITASNGGHDSSTTVDIFLRNAPAGVSALWVSPAVFRGLRSGSATTGRHRTSGSSPTGSWRDDLRPRQVATAGISGCPCEYRLTAAEPPSSVN